MCKVRGGNKRRGSLCDSLPVPALYESNYSGRDSKRVLCPRLPGTSVCKGAFEKAGVHVEHVPFHPETLDIRAKEKAKLVEKLFMIAKDHGAEAAELEELQQMAAALFAGTYQEMETGSVPKA